MNFKSSAFFAAGLAALGLAAQQGRAQDVPRDASPGYIIIFAKDYEGPGAKSYPIKNLSGATDTATLYDCAQRDAIRAYTTLAHNWGVPPDHIILLGEGPLINRFTTERMYPRPVFPGFKLEGQEAFKNACATWKQEVSLGKRVWIGSQIQEFADKADYLRLLHRDADGGPKTDELPVYGNPTAQNLHTACAMVSHLASADQFVLFVVSAHAGPTPHMVTLSSRSGLDANDFALPGCKARRQVAFLDAALTRPGAALLPQRRGVAKQFVESLQAEMTASGAQAAIVSSGKGDLPSFPFYSMNESSLLYSAAWHYL